METQLIRRTEFTKVELNTRNSGRFTLPRQANQLIAEEFFPILNADMSSSWLAYLRLQRSLYTGYHAARYLNCNSTAKFCCHWVSWVIHQKVPTDRFALKSFQCEFGFIYFFFFLQNSHLRANVTQIWHLLWKQPAKRWLWCFFKSPNKNWVMNEFHIAIPRTALETLNILNNPQHCAKLCSYCCGPN